MSGTPKAATRYAQSFACGNTLPAMGGRHPTCVPRADLPCCAQLSYTT